MSERLGNPPARPARSGRFESLDAAAESVRRWQAPRLGPEVSVRAVPVRVDAPASQDPRDTKAPAENAAGADRTRVGADDPAPEVASATGSGVPEEAPSSPPDEALLQRRFEEGRARGLADGEGAALEGARALLAALARERSRHETLLEDELLALARAMARLIVRRELEQDASLMQGLVRAALEELPRVATEPVVRLHPLDVAALREGMTPDEAETLVADPALARGDCRIESGASIVDAGIDAWLGRLAAEHGLLDPLERAAT